MFRRNKTHILVLLGFILLTALVTFPTACKMNSNIYGPFFGTDNRSVIWNFWRLKYNWENNLPSQLRSTIAYPFGVDYSLKPKFPISDFIFKWSTILTNEIFAFNFMLLVSFVLSGFFAYLLAFRITKNRVAAFISGLIFAFCPYHVNKAWEHFSLSQTQWIPLYALALLNLKDKPNFRNSVFVALAFSLIVGFDFSYAYIISTFTLGFIAFILLYQWKYKLGLKKDLSGTIVEKNNFKIIAMTGLALIIAALINFPILFPIFKNIFFTPKTDLVVSDIYVRSFKYLFSHSARPLSYLLPASSHPVFGKFTAVSYTHLTLPTN